jgi:hypothetical protein
LGLRTWTTVLLAFRRDLGSSRKRLWNILKMTSWLRPLGLRSALTRLEIAVPERRLTWVLRRQGIWLPPIPWTLTSRTRRALALRLHFVFRPMEPTLDPLRTSLVGILFDRGTVKLGAASAREGVALSRLPPDLLYSPGWSVPLRKMHDLEKEKPPSESLPLEARRWKWIAGRACGR